MTTEGPAKRRLPLGLIGAVLLLVAAVLVVAVMIPRRPRVDAGADARSACRAFGGVYAATRPGTPMNGRDLARRLEQAIGEMHRAASADARFKDLADDLDKVADAVNAGDAARAYAAMQTVDRGCDTVVAAPRSSA